MSSAPAEPADAPLRVIVAEDNFLAREAIGLVFAEAPEFEVVANCESLEELEQAVETLQPDVVVSDIRMPPTATDEGIRMAAELRDSAPDVEW